MSLLRLENGQTADLVPFKCILLWQWQTFWCWRRFTSSFFSFFYPPPPLPGNTFLHRSWLTMIWLRFGPNIGSSIVYSIKRLKNHSEWVVEILMIGDSLKCIKKYTDQDFIMSSLPVYFNLQNIFPTWKMVNVALESSRGTVNLT